MQRRQIGDSNQQVPTGLQHPRGLVENPIHITHMLEKLIGKDEVNTLIAKREDIPLRIQGKRLNTISSQSCDLVRTALHRKKPSRRVRHPHTL